MKPSVSFQWGGKCLCIKSLCRKDYKRREIYAQYMRDICTVSNIIPVHSHIIPLCQNK